VAGADTPLPPSSAFFTRTVPLAELTEVMIIFMGANTDELDVLRNI
jgi:hypothetical protein